MPNLGTVSDTGLPLFNGNGVGLADSNGLDMSGYNSTGMTDSSAEIPNVQDTTNGSAVTAGALAPTSAPGIGPTSAPSNGAGVVNTE